MAKKNGTTTPDAPSNEGGVFVNIQYIKDFSFENPNAPMSLIAKKEPPKIAVSVDVRIHPLEEKTYEVTLLTTARATSDTKDLFLAELAYAGIFTLEVAPQDIEPILMVYCPGLLFPFARQIIAEATRNGGFPPLLIDPIDFSTLYRQYKARQPQAVPANAENPGSKKSKNK
jgi:preprotein translocase subunit SecB